MLKLLSQHEWTDRIKQQRKLFFDERFEVVEALKCKHNCDAKYFVFEKKGKIVISLVALAKNAMILSPIHFFYSAFWVEPNLGDTKYCEYVADFLRKLQLEFKKISIRIPPAITDVRPFLWAGFSINNRFTYIKNLEQLEYAKDVHKNLEKASRLSYVYKEESISTYILDINLQIFSDLKCYTKTSINEIRTLLMNLAETGCLTCFSCYLEGKLLVSHILFVDEENKRAFTVLKNKLYDKQPGSLHSALYHQMFIHLKSKGFDYVDLLGADMEYISAFKSRFKADLRMANVATYSNINSRIYALKRKAVFFVKRIITIIRS